MALAGLVALAEISGSQNHGRNVARLDGRALLAEASRLFRPSGGEGDRRTIVPSDSPPSILIINN
jgi:hypothetical protein